MTDFRDDISGEMLRGYPLLLNNDYSGRLPRSAAGAFRTAAEAPRQDGGVRPAPPPARPPRSPRSPRDSSAAGRGRGIRGHARATCWVPGGLAWRGPRATNAYRTPGRCSAGGMSGNDGPRESKVTQVISVASETEHWLRHAWAGGRG